MKTRERRVDVVEARDSSQGPEGRSPSAVRAVPELVALDASRELSVDLKCRSHLPVRRLCYGLTILRLEVDYGAEESRASRS
jgi:hypothetical protein